MKSMKSNLLKAGKWKDAMGLVRVQKYNYFRQFVPNVAIDKLAEIAGDSDAEPGWARTSKAPPLEAEMRPCVILQVDISGFTRLSDRFQGSGQEGIDMLTTTINRMFGIIIDHVESWSGDIIKFAGDAVIVLWPCTEETMAQVTLQALTCAMELERQHGIFKVHVPDARTLAFADQLNRHFATAVCVDVNKGNSDGGDDWVPAVSPLEHIEITRRLHTISFLKVLSEEDIHLLSEKCSLLRYSQGDVIMRQGEPGESMLIVHAGVVSIHIRKPAVASSDGMASWEGLESDEDDIGDEVATREEGEFLGEMSLITGEARTATVLAHTNCVMINISAAGLLPLMASNPELKDELTDLMQQRLSGKPFTSGVKLRLHQALACGPMWMAHVGGASLDQRQGPRREFIVLGNALLESAQALDEAPTGTVVISPTAFNYVKDTYVGEVTQGGNYKVLGLEAGQQTMDIPRTTSGPTPQFHIWPILKMYCHEGARDLQDIAPFAADVRKLTVLFIRLELDLEKPSLHTVQMTHKACLVIQHAASLYRGTLRQFLQDDKGCVAICVMGMPPYAPHDNDPVRAVLAGLEMARKLPELGIGVYIGVTSGTAYSGFVGSQSRREMCAMGSIVNMSARLMCKAGKNEIWVDQETCDASGLMVQFETMNPITVKGRDAPLNVHKALQVFSNSEIRQNVLSLVKTHHQVQKLPPALENYFFCLLSKGINGCSSAFIRNVCNNLLENGHIHHNPDHTLVSKQNLLGLDNGQTSMQALARGDFESLSLQIHVQMLVKVLCFLSHRSLFSSALAKYVYSKTFPSFAMDFDASMHELVAIGMLEAARPEDIEQMISTTSSTCHECHSWTWQTPELQADMHAQQILFHEGALSDLRHPERQPTSPELLTEEAALAKRKASLKDAQFSMSLGRLPSTQRHTLGEKGGSRLGALQEASASKRSLHSLEKFVSECDPKSKLLKVYKCPIPGLVQSVIKGLLHSYQRVWHHQVAEFYEQKLDLNTSSSHLILAHHWSHAANHSQSEASHVQKAAQYLHMSARAAIQECAFREGIEQLHQACRILDRVPIQASTAQRKLDLLAEIAPHTLLLYGHGSPEAMAAYSGLMVMVCEDGSLDDQAARVLAGICVNLYGRQHFESGLKIARRIFKAGIRNDSSFQCEVALACMVQPLFFSGEFDALSRCFQRILKGYEKCKKSRKPHPTVNAVVYSVVALAYWPPMLLITGQIAEAKSKLELVMSLAEETGHPPTLCSVLCTLVNEYYSHTGEVEQCQDAATQAIAISEQYDLGHGRNLAYRAQLWCQNVGEHFDLLRAGERGQDVRGQAHNTTQQQKQRSASYYRLPHSASFGRLVGLDLDASNGRNNAAGSTSPSDSGSFGPADMRTFEIHGGRFGNLLGLQVLATRGKWKTISHRVAHTMASFKDNTEQPFYAEYLRILVAAGIAQGEAQANAPGQNDTPGVMSHAGGSNGGKDVNSSGAFPVESKAWVHVVQTQLRQCISHSLRNGCYFFALLGAVDWLCFEMDQSTKGVDSETPQSPQSSSSSSSPAPITPALVEAVTATKAIVTKIVGGEHLLPVMLANNLVRRYDDADLLASAPHAVQAGRDVCASAQSRQRKRSKTHLLLAELNNSGDLVVEVDQNADEKLGQTSPLTTPELSRMESMEDLTTTDLRQISAACGVKDARLIERRLDVLKLSQSGSSKSLLQTADNLQNAQEEGGVSHVSPHVLKLSQSGGSGVKTGSSKSLLQTAHNLQNAQEEGGVSHVSPHVLAEIKALESHLAEVMARQEVIDALKSCDEWNFDAFRLHQVTSGRPMQTIGMHLLAQHGLVQALSLDSARLAKFLLELENGMPQSNPYHNAIHVADVTQTVHVLLTKGGIGKHLDKVEVLACLIAALVHDFEHLGLNNDYLVKVCHERALSHNDRAPNENHHVMAAFKVMRRPECNFCESLNTQQLSQMRKVMIDMVLATDMAEHQRIVSLLKQDLPQRLHKDKLNPNAAEGSNAGGVENVQLDAKGVSLMLCGAIKIADLGHAFASFDVHKKWSSRLEEELFLQGDEERRRNLPISYLMDRAKPGVTKSQKGFFDYVVRPLVTSWIDSFPDSSPLLDQMEINLSHWKQLGGS